MNNPKVTVYIPTYNRKLLLDRAINSIINQTYGNIEIIVVDDNSTDGTQDFLKMKSKQFNNLRYFLKNKNSGACASRNIAIKNAKGEFITGLDDDDYFLPNRINDFIDLWGKKEENVVFLYSSYTSKSDNENSLKRSLRKSKISFEDLLKVNDIGNQIFTKTEVLLKNAFDERLPMWQDFKCWLDILHKGGIAQGVNNYSYVIDKSHPHERISNKKREKLIDAENIIKNSFKLDKYQLLYLENHKCNYGSEYRMKTNYILILLFKLDFDLFFKFRLLKQYCKNLM